MKHKDILNQILANECPRQAFGKFRLFSINLHCATMNLVCELLPTTEIRYKVLYSDMSDSISKAQEFYMVLVSDDVHK